MVGNRLAAVGARFARLGNDGGEIAEVGAFHYADIFIAAIIADQCQ